MQLMKCHNDAQQSEDRHSCKPINTKSALLRKWEVTAMTKHCSWPASKGAGPRGRGWAAVGAEVPQIAFLLAPRGGEQFSHQCGLC